MKRTARRAKSAIGESAAGLQGVIDSADAVLESIQDMKGEATDRVRERISDTVRAARDRLEELDVPELAADAFDGTMGFLRRNPWRTAAIGAAAVLACSLLMRRDWRS